MSRRLHALILVATLLVAVIPRAASAGDECLSSKLTNELMTCAHCQAVKKLLNDRAIGQVTMEIHELAHGVIIEIEATQKSAVPLVHGLADEIWNAEAHCQTTMSDLCTARAESLRTIDVERALSSHGALVVLRAEEPARVAWILEDARDTRSYLLAAASR